MSPRATVSDKNMPAIITASSSSLYITEGGVDRGCAGRGCMGGKLKSMCRHTHAHSQSPDGTWRELFVLQIRYYYLTGSKQFRGYAGLRVKTVDYLVGIFMKTIPGICFLP